jgi:hypothetical protein
MTLVSNSVSNFTAVLLYLQHDRADNQQSAARMVRQITPTFLPCISLFTSAALCGMYAGSNLPDVDIFDFNRTEMFLILFARSRH